MVKCPFCQTEMTRRTIHIQMEIELANAVKITYDNVYRCQAHGEIVHANRAIRVDLP